MAIRNQDLDLNLGLVHAVAPVFNENHKSIAFVRNLSRQRQLTCDFRKI
jgi:hypothetical protein